jgi:predicted site-specific integrase-resolvase
MSDQTKPDPLELIRISDFARRLKVTVDAVRKWSRLGRLNRSRTRLVKLRLVKSTWGYGVTDELYRQFIRELDT